MDSQERQLRILDLARAEGKVDVAGLASTFGIAVETARRDLRALVERGVLRRVHGGAVAVETTGFESDAGYRASANVREKRRIASAAAALLHGAESVYLDEGFTPRLIAEELASVARLTVVTASLPAAQALASSTGVTVLLLGGRMRGRTLATVDHWALRMLCELQIDVAFLGANGISREHGLTTPDPAVAAIKTAAVNQSRRRVLVGTHTKFGVSSFCRFAMVPDFETIVTDQGLSVHEAKRYEALGPRVLRI
ncbi:DeoR/GlpR family DNA-binding transcription regulator [Arthrobacter sp. FW306-04-A]|uniref:DeoR/GlpR family DNA-binding transcription regulator n=1 Tax=Arthrobacter sp. FW306-04-A TaxID=2879619 RepID=UPI0037BE3AFA|nr:DeoR/GlpR family DNA-binding transcription regulator [Arthrobacter sp. FW306-04-A]